MIKLIAIDLDGTLLNSAKQIPTENIKAIQKAAKAGVKIVLCTGRPKSGILPYFEQLGLTDEEYIIMNNGCSVYNTKQWELVSHAQISKEDLEKLNRVLADYPEVCLTLTTEEHYYAIASQVPELVQYDAGLVFDTAQAISFEEAKASSELIFQAMYMAKAPYLDVFQEAQESTLAADFSVVRSQEYIFEAMPKGYTKATALKALSEKLGFSPAEVMAIGDAANDIEMLNFAGHSVAMGNATDEVKALCRYQTTSNDQAGVAQAIYDYGLTQEC